MTPAARELVVATGFRAMKNAGFSLRVMTVIVVLVHGQNHG